MDIELENLSQEWDILLDKLERMMEKRPSDLNSVLFLIGVQELGKGHRFFTKEEKQDLMHIAICKLLEPYGYYEFEFFDKEGWPHYKVIKELPALKAGEQSVLMKEAIVNYFLEKEIIE